MGMMVPVHRIADIVQVTGDVGQLCFPAVIAQLFQNVAGDIGHHAHMTVTVLRIAKGGKAVIAAGNIGVDQWILFDFVKCDYMCNSSYPTSIFD